MTNTSLSEKKYNARSSVPPFEKLLVEYNVSTHDGIRLTIVNQDVIAAKFELSPAQLSRLKATPNTVRDNIICFYSM